MTSICKIVIGNRQSGKTRMMLSDVYSNLAHDPSGVQVIFNAIGEHNSFKRRLSYSNLNSPHVKVYHKYTISRIRLQGLSNYYLYIDEFEHIPPDTANEIIHTVALDHKCKGLHIYLTPKLLRNKELLEPTNSSPTPDPLINLLRVADFDFTLLFNSQLAQTYLNSSFDERIILTEGLGLLSKFD